MAANIALKRFNKAVRRKAVVAEKRKAEALEASLAGQVRRAASAPIQHCLIQEALFEQGFGTLIVTRGPTNSQVTMCTFLLDVFCLGIKNVMFKRVGAEELALVIGTLEATSPFIAVDPAYARKLLRDLAAWAGAIGFAPHRDFATVERMFGDVNADESDAVFSFGRDGKPFYIPGPSESPSLIRHRMEHLRKQFGDENFESTLPE